MLASSEDWISGERLGDRGGSSARSRGLGLKAALLVSAALVGAVLPHALPLDLSRHVEAEARLQLGSQPTGDAARADFLTAATEELQKPALLDAVSRRLALGDNAAATKAPTAMGLLTDIMSRTDTSVSAAEAAERQRLLDALSLSGPMNGQLGILARDNDALSAAALANAAADVLAQRLSGRNLLGEPEPVRSARAHLEKLQADAAALTVTPAEMQSLQDVRQGQETLAAEGERQQAAMAELAARIDVLSQLSLDDVLARPLPPELQASGLETLRRKHVDAKLLVDQLSADLGPRHPRLMAAAAAEEEARQSISRAMKQMTAGARQEEASLRKEIQEREARATALSEVPISDNARRKLDLDSALEQARNTYLEAVRLADESGAAGAGDIRLVVAATPATATVAGLPGWLYSLAGAIAGLCLAGAALPGRRPMDIEPETDAEPFEASAQAHDIAIEPQFTAIEDEPVIDLLAMEAADQHLDPLPRPIDVVLPVMPSFDEYYRQEREQEIRPNEIGNGQDHLAAEATDEDPLERLLMASRQSHPTDRPLPQLLAAIMAGQAATAIPVSADEDPEPTDRAIAELRQSIALLRSKVANQMPDEEDWLDERRYAGRR